MLFASKSWFCVLTVSALTSFSVSAEPSRWVSVTVDNDTFVGTDWS